GSARGTGGSADDVLASPALERALEAAQRAIDAVPELLGDGEGVGSNSWVVSGEHTASGLPLLANDPHLGISAPGIWSQQSLRCANVGPLCPFDVSGFTFAGLPGVIIGHNADLAWGLTNLGADVTDFFVERLTDDGGYLYDDASVPLEVRHESIIVNGAEPVELEVRSTAHGPIVSDVLELEQVERLPVAPSPVRGAPDLAVSLAWTALTPGRTADAVFAFATAATPADIADAAALFEVPSQNIVFATVDGQIGYQAPGKIPVRADVPSATLPSDGTWPRPGWDPAFDWQGFVAAEDMPAVVDPPEGFVVAANQAVTPVATGPFLSADWDYGYRSQRIRDLLVERIAAGPLTGEDMSQIQLDAHSAFADVLVPWLLAIEIDGEFDAAGQELLRSWDRSMDVDSAAAVYFAAVWQNLLELTFRDELPASQWPDGGSRWLEVVRAILDDPRASWWDDRTTVGVEEGRDEMLSRALVGARAELTQRLGKDPADWSWGKLHLAAPEHAVLGGASMPAPLRALVNPRPLGVAGGSSIVNANGWDAADPDGSFYVTWSPSMRMVVDLADLDASTWVVMTGTSGHPGSRHYTDQFTAWAQGETFPWPFSATAVTRAARSTLTLRPGS
ncbi:MAG: penicillin acylase family protein, partial [Actinomycetota bacterium]|nr:penicillin acylase family protein [Actinomycetota bacterium]